MKASYILAAAFWLVWLPLSVQAQEAQEETAAAQTAEDSDTFDKETFIREFRQLLVQRQFDEASSRLKEAIEKHPDDDDLRELHFTAYMFLQRTDRKNDAFEHLKTFIDYQIKSAREVGGSSRYFTLYLGELVDLAAQIDGPERAFEILDEYAKQIQELDNSTKEEFTAAIETQRALQLAKAGRVDEAKALVDKWLEAANAALSENPNDADAILRVAAALKIRVPLESAIEGGDPNSASSEHLEFLHTKAKEQPESMPLVQHFAMEHMNRASSLARTNPDEASALLDRIESFDETPEEVDEAKESEEDGEAKPPGNSARISFGPLIARLRQQIENSRKMLALIGAPAVYPENVDGWVNGEPLTPDALKGKVVLLDFFAVWCGPCIATFPHLREWHEEYAEKGLTIIGVTSYYKYGWDEEAGRPKGDPEIAPEAERAAMEQFVKHHELQHPVAFVTDRQLQEHYIVSGIPHAVVIDRQGNVRLFRIGSGEANAADLKKAIEESLGETPPE